MKTTDKIFLAVLALEAAATAIFYFFFSAWDGGYCNQPGILNPLGQTASGTVCIQVALHLDRGGVPFYVSLDILLATLAAYVIYKIICALKKGKTRA